MAEHQRALWVSTSLTTRGGISTFVRAVRETSLWQQWDIHHVATHRNGTMTTRMVAFGIGLLRFMIELIFRRPGIVHIHVSSYGSFFRKCILTWISSAFRIPVVLHVHGSEFHTFFVDAPSPVQKLIRKTLEQADIVIALGNAWADRLQQIAPDADIAVVPNAVQPDAPVDQYAAGPVGVLFLGEVGDRKGTFTLLEAWAKIMAADTDGSVARLTIAGDGDVERARNTVASHAIGGSVEILGWIDSSAVPGMLSAAQILVLPSQSEGQPMAILEAMARGVCVVASNVGGIPELLDESCGILISPDDVTELADALTIVVNNPDTRAELGTNALRRVREQFDIDLVSSRFSEMYRQLTE